MDNECTVVITVYFENLISWEKCTKHFKELTRDVRYNEVIELNPDTGIPPVEIQGVYCYSAEKPVGGGSPYLNISGEVEGFITEVEMESFIRSLGQIVQLEDVGRVECFYHEPCVGLLGLYSYEDGRLYVRDVEEIPGESEECEDPEYYERVIRDYGKTKFITEIKEN